MEIILGLVVVAAAAYWLFGRKKDEQPEAVAPYKVDTPAPVEAQPVADVVPEAVVVVEEKPAKAKKAPAKKPAAKKAPAKKPATKTKKTTTK